MTITPEAGAEEAVGAGEPGIEHEPLLVIHAPPSMAMHETEPAGPHNVLYSPAATTTPAEDAAATEQAARQGLHVLDNFMVESSTGASGSTIADSYGPGVHERRGPGGGRDDGGDHGDGDDVGTTQISRNIGNVLTLGQEVDDLCAVEYNLTSDMLTSALVTIRQMGETLARYTAHPRSATETRHSTTMRLHMHIMSLP